MWLQEEYFHRHDINVLLPLHAKKGSLFLGPTESFSPQKIFFIFFEWKEGRLHPGKYSFSYFRPIHNGFRKHKFFESVNTFKLHSDEYESHWLNLKNSSRFSPIASSDQVQLMAWSIFLFCYDEWASQNGLHDLFFETIDPLVSESKRISFCKKAILYLKDNYFPIYSNYNNQVLDKLRCYSYWAAELIKKT